MKTTVGMLMGIYNEAGRIIDCLDYHQEYFDEIVIVCQKSDDGTEDLIDEYAKTHPKIKILKYPKMGCSEATLQFGADALTTDWILYVDADEKFPKDFLTTMHEIAETSKVDGYWFERDNWFKIRFFNEAVPIEPKFLDVQHPTRDRQLRFTRRSMTWFPPQVHVRARVRGPLGNGHDELMSTLNYHMYHYKTLDEQYTDNSAYLPETRIVDAMEKTKRNDFIVIPKAEKRGTLYFAEIEKQIPFPIKRVFFIRDVPEGTERGGHANQKVHEVLFCLQGSVKVDLDDGQKVRGFTLDTPENGLFIKNKTWIRMYDFSKDCILACLASEFYYPEHYISTYEEFKKVVMPNQP